ncbi:MAG: hypothetical protein P8Z39_04835, partial [Gammaproteobacteria bacterium]
MSGRIPKLRSLLLILAASLVVGLPFLYEQFYADSVHGIQLFTFVVLGVTAILLVVVWMLLGRLHESSRKAEQSWRRLYDAVDSLSEAFALFDDAGRLVLHNRKWREFYPWLKGNLSVGTPLAHLRELSVGHFSAVTTDGRAASRQIPPGQTAIERDLVFCRADGAG